MQKKTSFRRTNLDKKEGGLNNRIQGALQGPYFVVSGLQPSGILVLT